MARVDDLIADLTAQRDKIQKQLDFLQGENGRIVDFLRAEEAAGRLDIETRDAAALIVRWQQYEASNP